MKRLVLLSFLFACSESQEPQVAPRLQITAGNNQSAAVGKELPNAVRALLSDNVSGAPLTGRVVNWVVISGNGAVFAGATETGNDGIASQRWTLGGIVGEQRLVVRWVDPETGLPVTIDTAKATAMPDVAVEFNATFGSPNNLAVNEEGIVEYWFEDDFGNVTTTCKDGGSANRIAWVSDDPASLEVLPGVRTQPNGRAAIAVRALAAKQGITVTGTPNPACADALSAGVLFNVS